MILKLISFAIYFQLAFAATAGPIVVGNAAGSEENQYVALWTNRVEYFSHCLNSSESCGLTADEMIILQKISQTSLLPSKFLFYSSKDFNTKIGDLIVPLSTPFVAYSPSAGAIVFNQDLMYKDEFKFDLDEKLRLLVLISAAQAKLENSASLQTIEKFVRYWEQKIQKFDLSILGHRNLQIWLHADPLTNFILIDDVSTTDLAKLLISGLPCGTSPNDISISSPRWESYTQNGPSMFTSFGGGIRYSCDGLVSELNFEIDIQFFRTDLRWQLDPEKLRPHFSTLD